MLQIERMMISKFRYRILGVLVLLTLFQINIFGQDGVFLYKKIQFSFLPIALKDQFLGFDFYRDAQLQMSEPGQLGFQMQISQMEDFQRYELEASYSGIGGNSHNRLNLPMIYLKVYFYSSFSGYYSHIIPMKFEICATSNSREFHYLRIDLNQVVERRYEMIELSEQGITYDSCKVEIPEKLIRLIVN